MKYQGNYQAFRPIFSRCGLTMLLTAVLLVDSVGAMPRGTKLQIAQQQGTQQEDIRAKAERLFQEGKQLYKQGTKESLLQAINKWEQALPLFRAVGDKHGEAIIFNYVGLFYDELEEKQKALKFFNQALSLFIAVGDKGREAATRNNIGRIHEFQRETQKALEYYHQALPLTRAVKDRRGEAITCNNIGRVYEFQGETQKALEYYHKALPFAREVEDRRGQAFINNNIGRVYEFQGETQKALEYYHKALPLLRAVEDRGGEATTLNNIGSVYSNLGEKQKALEYYNQALPLSRELEDKRGEAINLNNIGLVYSDLEEKQKALEYYNQALSLRRELEDKRGEAITLNNIGSLYENLGEKQKALEYYKQALPLLRAVEDRGGEATTLNNIGLVYFLREEKQEALEYYNQALLLIRTIRDKRREATTLGNIGTVYHSQGEKQKALENYNQALLLIRTIRDKSGEATTLNNIGNVYSNLGEKQKALEYLNQALPILRTVGNKDGEATNLYNIAYVQRSQNNLQAALTNIQSTIKIIEELRTKIASTELRTSYFGTKQGYYKFYIDLLMQLHKQNPNKGYDAQALHISESSRARGLVELLTEANINIRKDINPQLLAEETRLQSLRDGKEKLLSQLMSQPKPPNEIIQTTNQEIQNIIQQQKELKNKLRATNKEYANLKYPQPLTLPQIQQQLDPDTVLLQYSLGAENSYLWLVTNNSFTTYQLPKETDINKITQPLISKLKAPVIAGASPQETAKDVAKTAKAANELSQVILKPVADKLGKKRLVIVADGILHQIPFAVLSDITEKTKYQPLLVNHEIINLPSITSLSTHREKLKNRKIAPKKLAVLADPVFSNNDSRVTGKTEIASSTDLDLERSALRRSSANRGTLSRLPGTRKEAEAVLKFVPNNESIKAFDFDANYEWVMREKLNQYQMVLFATHGLIDMKNPELSGIVLSLFDQQGNPKKGFLRLDDIFNLDLPAELVVLSACESGLGEEVKGEGLIGLTRGFMYAGAAKVVISLWNVNDEATAELMTEFSGQVLKKGQSPIVALRNAQLKLWQQQKTQDPRFWAAFTIQGEWQK
ncbi:tetratricopeptide repeat protein [Anabaena sp. UHCC 0253]|uniref:tetratricopeptide repeat protein n=1 Tax=Anabaena sp. UHCC 0253 TaxID=2590019 RepID=UPI00144524D1|nr:tetratricopeptide repeat protein [Anabaena sp. UHCC 0253]MTJ55894.1 tetratricopeptide repeat protein [Anabaena sp. UHCC 0253]